MLLRGQVRIRDAHAHKISRKITDYSKMEIFAILPDIDHFRAICSHSHRDALVDFQSAAQLRAIVLLDKMTPATYLWKSVSAMYSRFIPIRFQ